MNISCVGYLNFLCILHKLDMLLWLLTCVYLLECGGLCWMCSCIPMITPLWFGCDWITSRCQLVWLCYCFMYRLVLEILGCVGYIFFRIEILVSVEYGICGKPVWLIWFVWLVMLEWCITWDANGMVWQWVAMWQGDSTLEDSAYVMERCRSLYVISLCKKGASLALTPVWLFVEHISNKYEIFYFHVWDLICEFLVCVWLLVLAVWQCDGWLY